MILIFTLRNISCEDYFQNIYKKLKRLKAILYKPNIITLYKISQTSWKKKVKYSFLNMVNFENIHSEINGLKGLDSVVILIILLVILKISLRFRNRWDNRSLNGLENREKNRLALLRLVTQRIFTSMHILIKI